MSKGATITGDLAKEYLSKQKFVVKEDCKQTCSRFSE